MGIESEAIHIGSHLWLLVATLGALLWVSVLQREQAGYWFFAAALATATDGLISAFATPPDWLLLLSGDAIIPLASYLFYRGVAAYTESPPAAWPLALMFVTTASWAVTMTERTDFSLPLVMTAQIPIVLASVWMLWKSRQSTLSRILTYLSAPIVLAIVANPWFRGSTDAFADRATEIAFWNAALIPLTLAVIYALLERNIVGTQHALEESSEHLRIAATQAGLGTWTYSTRTDEIRGTNEMWDIYQWMSPAKLEADEFVRFMADPNDYERIRKMVRRTLAENTPLQFDTAIKLANGSIRFISCHAGVIQRRDGEKLLVGSILDVTDQRHTIEELKSYRNRLEEIVKQRTEELNQSRELLIESERLASLGTLTAGLAHQVNNPIGAIQAAADFAKRCEGDPDELEILRGAVEDIEDEARRCGRIVRGMLQFARAQPAEKEELLIDDVIQRMLPALQRQARRHDATLEFEHIGRSPTVSLSRLEFEQALTNIVVNAFQSRESGVLVKMIRRCDESNVVLEIQDDGPGIRSEVLSHILEPFYTSKLGEGGTGLGLSIAHGVAQAHGGDLSLTSEFGVGTCARLKLPISSAAPAPEPRHPRFSPPPP